MALFSHKPNLEPLNLSKKNKKKSTSSDRQSGSRRHIFAQIAILQNGELLTDLTTKVRRKGRITLYSDINHRLSLPHYPLPDGKLDILEMRQSACRLMVDPSWKGFYSHKGRFFILEEISAGPSEIELTVGDYASIIRGDLRILVRLDFVKKSRSLKQSSSIKALKHDWRNPFTRHFLSSREEYIASGIAAFAATILVGSFCLGLGSRNPHRPTTVNEIKDKYMLSFLAPEHIESAPETLQEKLQRKSFLQSVTRYYQSFIRLINNSGSYDRNLLLPTSVAMFEKLKLATEESLHSKIKNQKSVDNEQANLKDVATLTIPGVLGQSLAGKMLQTNDKIGIIRTASELNLAAKRHLINDFSKDDPYDYENYRNIQRQDTKPPVPDAIKQIHVWGHTNAEDVMYLEAKSLAAAAQSLQSKRFSKISHSGLLTEADAKPIELPAGTKYASFLSDLDFFLVDEKFDEIQAEEFGTPRKVTKSQENLTGEIDPSLIENYIKQNRYQLQLCYELALRRDEEAAGTMEWRWRIDTRGLISDISLVTSAIKDQPMIQCIHRKIATWRFPRPRYGSVEVSYPFDFNPSKG